MIINPKRKDYMDPDVAYLLGLIMAKGTLDENGVLRRLIIEFNFKNLEAHGIEKVFKTRDQLILGMIKIRERISELLDTNIEQKELNNKIILKATFTKNALTWRNIRALTQGKNNFREFSLPDYFFDFDREIKSEFIRGIVDATGFIRPSNQYVDGQHRIYIQINNSNWILPIQICQLLQEDLEVPVQLIQWGHPNTREPNITNVSKDHTGWAREHQIKIFADEFIPIGFYIYYKQEILQELADLNDLIGQKHKICNPEIKKVRSLKPEHPCESSDGIPDIIRGQHFNSYWQICKALKCKQGKPSPQGRFELTEEE